MKPYIKHVIFLAVFAMFLTVAAGPVPPQPNVQIEVVSPLPATMNVGDTFTVEILVTSDVTFISAAAMPSAYYPGRYLVAQGINIVHSGTTATLYVTFTAKDPTGELPGGVAPVSVVVGVRYPMGVLIAQRYDYLVAVN